MRLCKEGELYKGVFVKSRGRCYIQGYAQLLIMIRDFLPHAATKPIVLLLFLLSPLHARKMSREDWRLRRAESEKNVVVSIEIVGNNSKSAEHFV